MRFKSSLQRCGSLAFSVMDRWMLPAAMEALSRVAPPRHWYWSAFRLSGVLGPLVLGRGPVERARLLNRCLALLTRKGRSFPVPWTVTGIETLCQFGGEGIVLCSGHVPLIKVALRVLLEIRFPLTAAIASTPGEDGTIAVWGLRERLPAFRVQPNVLVRSRTVLRKGGSIVMLADAKPGADYSLNIFHLVRKSGGRVVFFFTELQSDGTIAVRFEAPPDPLCTNEEGIRTNLLALDRAVTRILRRQAPEAPVEALGGELVEEDQLQSVLTVS